jgi:hypothetical protein
MKFIPSDVCLNIRELIIFLLMRHPHSGITSTLLSCSTSRNSVTDSYHVPVQIITFVVMCSISPITLHCNTVIKEIE